MNITIPINDETEEYSTLFMALKSLEDYEDHRWGIPRPRDIESGAAPPSMTMRALYVADRTLVATNPQTGLYTHLIELGLYSLRADHNNAQPFN